MRKRFYRTWDERVHRAAAWTAGQDPTPVLEALASALVLHLVEDKPITIDDHIKQQLEPVASQAIDQAKEQPEEDWHAAIKLAEAGYKLIQDKPVAIETLPSDLVRPSPNRITRMLDGRLDGLSAATCAIWCIKHNDGAPKLVWEQMQEAQSEPMLLAATDPLPIRNPSEGVVVATHKDPTFEVVYFEKERELAVYAEEETYVSVTGEGFEAKDVKSGYWLGRVVGRGRISTMRVNLSEGSVALSLDRELLL